jgi:hypothetical protein
MNNLHKWMAKAEHEQQYRLAVLAETTYPYLQQLAGGHRYASQGLVKRLEEGAKRIRLFINPKLPVLRCNDLLKPVVKKTQKRK